jgi:hypothetical protein
MNDLHLVLHGLAIKKHGDAAGVAGLMGLAPETAAAVLADLEARGRVAAAGGKYVLTPAARIALQGEYSRVYAALRSDRAFAAAHERFERINADLKALITDWQMKTVGGQLVPNDHADRAHDRRIIDRLGDLHERAEGVLSALAAGLPRLAIYRAKLTAALEKAEDGAIEWVSDARIESYHTVWFELHEDLLRILGRERTE